MANKGKTFPAEILTDGEVQRLLGRCSNRVPTGIRNRALITVLYRAGLRLDEALHLDPVHIDTQAGWIRVLHGKGDRARTVGLDPGACAMVELWLGERICAAGIVHTHCTDVFCTLKGRRVSAGYVRTLLPRLARRAGIAKRVHAHGLRHTHAAQLAAEGVPTNMIQAQLGHASLATTDTYLKHVAPVELIERMRGREWKSNE